MYILELYQNNYQKDFLKLQYQIEHFGKNKFVTLR